MPVYLLHGFRWPREGLTGIRVRAIMHDLEDCSVDYIQNERSTAALFGSFRNEFPDIMKALEGPGRSLTIVEQYDPNDVFSDEAVCQPYAYVGDRVVTIAGTPTPAAPNVIQETQAPLPPSLTVINMEVAGRAMSPSPRTQDSALSVNVEEIMSSGPGVTPQFWEAFADLRDKIAPREKIGWFVIYNGDPERSYNEEDDDDEDEEECEPKGKRNATGAPSDEKEISTMRGVVPSLSPSDGRQMPPPMTIPVRAKGKRTAGTTSPNEKSLPPEPPQPKTSPKSSSFAKKLFGKK